LGNSSQPIARSPPVETFARDQDPLRPSAVQLFCAAKSLFDHLVGAQQDGLRHRKAERLGGLEVQDHLVFRRQLHREIARRVAQQIRIQTWPIVTI